jgi:transcriptional regulator with XRE-family HTH domain
MPEPRFTKPVSKAELARVLGLSNTTLWNWLNKRYIAELEKVGYHKNQKLLTPAQLNVLAQILGISKEDF